MILVPHKRYLLLLLLICAFSSGAVAQKTFKGRIIYKLSYPGSMIDYAELQNMPVTAVVYTKNNLVRTEMPGVGLSQVKIADGNTRTVSTLLDILREKYVITVNQQQIENALRTMPQARITFTNETKEILGYTCRKAEAVVYDDMGNEYVSEIYYTEAYSGTAFNFDLPYNTIPGLMLEYQIRVGPLNIHYEAQSIRGRLFVGNKHFRIPRDYQSTNFEELRDRLQGNF